MKKITAAILGCGNRGQAYGDYTFANQDELEIVAVADVNERARRYAAEKYGVPDDRVFKNVRELVNAHIPLDIVIDATMDAAHYETAKVLLNGGYDILLEKPITAVPGELLELQRLAEEKKRRVIICHVLRYTPYFKKIKDLINRGEIGEIVNIEANEHVWISHFIESYVRGPWKSEKECGSGFLLAKSCHDIDIICWLNNATRVKAVSSFAHRALFVPRNKPKGATEFCYNCPHEKKCLYSAIKLHLDFAPMAFQTYAGLIKETGKELKEFSREDKLRYLMRSDYGKCAYNGGDLVDRQSVMIDFENGSTATFNLIGGTCRADRYIHIIGSIGEIEGKIGENKFVLRTMDRSENHYRYIEREYDVSEEVLENECYSGHAGGDYAIVHDLIRFLNGEESSVSITTLEDSITGHFVCYEAEESRKSGKTIYNREFIKYTEMK